ALAPGVTNQIDDKALPLPIQASSVVEWGGQAGCRQARKGGSFRSFMISNRVRFSVNLRRAQEPRLVSIRLVASCLFLRIQAQSLEALDHLYEHDHTSVHLQAIAPVLLQFLR